MKLIDKNIGFQQNFNINVSERNLNFVILYKCNLNVLCNFDLFKYKIKLNKI